MTKDDVREKVDAFIEAVSSLEKHCDSELEKHYQGKTTIQEYSSELANSWATLCDKWCDPEKFSYTKTSFSKNPRFQDQHITEIERCAKGFFVFTEMKLSASRPEEYRYLISEEGRISNRWLYCSGNWVENLI